MRRKASLPSIAYQKEKPQSPNTPSRELLIKAEAQPKKYAQLIPLCPRTQFESQKAKNRNRQHGHSLVMIVERTFGQSGSNQMEYTSLQRSHHHPCE